MSECINLLPAEFQQRDLLRTRIMQWSAAWIVTAILMGGGALWKLSSGAALRQRAHNLEQQCAPLRGLIRENQQIKDRLAEISGRQSLFAELDRAQRPLQVLGIISHSAQAADKRIHVERLEWLPAPQPAVLKPASAHPAATTATPAKPLTLTEQRTRLVLTGLATDDIAVARFITGLRSVGVFHKVDLQSSSRVSVTGNLVRRYEIDCVF